MDRFREIGPLRILRVMTAVTWIAAAGVFVGIPAEAGVCDDLCEGCPIGSGCKNCATIGEATCLSPEFSV